MNKVLKTIFLLLFIFFLSLYFSRYTNGYYESQSVLTDKAISNYESDLREGKAIKAGSYLEEEKHYNNKASEFGMKTSNFIEKIFNKGLRYLMKYLEKLEKS